MIWNIIIKFIIHFGSPFGFLQYQQGKTHHQGNVNPYKILLFGIGSSTTKKHCDVHSDN